MLMVDDDFNRGALLDSRQYMYTDAAVPPSNYVIPEGYVIDTDVKNAHVSDRGFICEIDDFMPVGSCTYNGHLYQLYDDNISWEYAKTIAESKGGYLASITDENENNAIVDMITDCNGTKSFYWLGASDVEKEGVWKWLNGETLEYSNWQTGQPDNYQSGTLSENYLHLYNDSERMGLWNDIISPHTDVGFICEYELTNEDDIKSGTYADFFAETVGITGIAFEKKSVGLYVGDNAQMSVDITPVNATENVNWESDNVAVATVDDYGNVTALTEGIANIIAISESGAVTAKCVVYVTDIIDENEPTIYCNSIDEIKNGDTFDVNISLKNNPGIASMRLTLTYDKSVMALTNVTDLGLIGEAVHSSDYTVDNYTLYWDNGTATSNFADDGDIVTLTFMVNDTVKSGDYPIMITYDYNNSDIVNCELIPVRFEIVNGFVTIKSFTYGDVNDDGRVNALDSAYLSRYIAKWTGVSINLNAADVNKDGKINALDSAILKRHIARWTNYGTLPH